MKALIFLYTNTNNTRLTCEYLAKQIPELEWEFYDIKQNKDLELSQLDFSAYSLFGFACYTDAWDVPKFMRDFISRIPQINHKYTFVLNTFGATTGKTLLNLANLVQAREFTVINGYSLHCPENYPPMIALGLGNAQAPSVKEIKYFSEFISALKKNINLILGNQKPLIQKIAIGFWKFTPTYPHALIDLLMGKKKVDKTKCIKCGLCARNCPVQAIILAPYPVFNENKCQKCWACYNLCPQQAISTSTCKKAHYPKPDVEFTKKLA